MATVPNAPGGCMAACIAESGSATTRFPGQRGERSAFTLVEIMIVVVIIGLLAAMAIPAFQRMRERSQATRMANDFRQIESAFQRFVLETGSWPVATGMGLVPTGMSGYLPNAYTQASPLGGMYLWSGPSHNVVLRGTQASDSVMQLVDAVLDDGVLNTGDFTKIGPNTFGYCAR